MKALSSRRSILLAVVTGLIGACSSPEPSRSPDTQAVAATSEPRPSPSPSGSPRPTSAPTSTPTEPPATPPPTIPPARTWLAGNVALDLPAGWSGPPGSHALAIVFALDQLGDPPAGLLSMLLLASPSDRTSFVFRVATGFRPTAGIGARRIAGDDTLREVVSSSQSALERGGIEVRRGRIDLPVGGTPFLEWDQPIRWGSIHMRAYFFRLPDGVARIDIGTDGVADPGLEGELRHILESVRPIG